MNRLVAVALTLSLSGCGIRALGGIPSPAERAAERCANLRAKAAAEPSTLVPAETWTEQDARGLMFDLQFQVGADRACLAGKIQENFTVAGWDAFVCDPETRSVAFSERTKARPRIKEFRAQCASESKARAEEALKNGWRRIGE